MKAITTKTAAARYFLSKANTRGLLRVLPSTYTFSTSQ